MALTREGERSKDDENRLRSYSEKVIIDANRVRKLRYSLSCYECYLFIKFQVQQKREGNDGINLLCNVL